MLKQVQHDDLYRTNSVPGDQARCQASLPLSQAGGDRSPVLERPPRSIGPVANTLDPPPPSPHPAAMARTYTSFADFRSEEHTSELQSLMRNSYAVFRLKKKKKRFKLTPIRTHKHCTPSTNTTQYMPP